MRWSKRRVAEAEPLDAMRCNSRNSVRQKVQHSFHICHLLLDATDEDAFSTNLKTNLQNVSCRMFIGAQKLVNIGTLDIQREHLSFLKLFRKRQLHARGDLELGFHAKL